MKLCLAYFLLSTLFVFTCSVPVPDSEENLSEEKEAVVPVDDPVVVPATEKVEASTAKPVSESEGIIDFIAQEIFNLGGDEEEKDDTVKEEGDKEVTPQKGPVETISETVGEFIDTLFTDTKKVQLDKEQIKNDENTEDVKQNNRPTLADQAVGVAQNFLNFLQNNPLVTALQNANANANANEGDNKPQNGPFVSALQEIQHQLSQAFQNTLNNIVPNNQNNPAKPSTVPKPAPEAEGSNEVDTQLAEESEEEKGRDVDNALKRAT